MNILVLDTIYQPILDSIERDLDGRTDSTFESIRQRIISSRFGTSGCYEYYFSKAGFDCIEIVTNSLRLQSAWAREHGIKYLNTFAWDKSFLVSRAKVLHPFINQIRHFHFLALEQVNFYKPDILIIKDIHEFPREVLKRFKKATNFIVGFCSSQVLDSELFMGYDLILSSVPSNLEIAKMRGVNSRRIFPAFDTRNLEYASEIRDISTSFIGSIYEGTVQILQAVYEVDPNLMIYAPNPDSLRGESKLLNNYGGKVWGPRMYSVYGRTKIAINRHGKIASDFAGNMRLFEATGMGACLITEYRTNLETLFNPKKEVVPYNSIEDLQVKLDTLIKSDMLRNEIANAGHLRCISHHSYSVRVNEILDAFGL